MNPIFKTIQEIEGEGCVTITMNTHRTQPSNGQDPINLKNLIAEAENRLERNYDKHYAKRIIQNLREVSEEIDHNHNLESLVIFAGKDFKYCTKLSIDLEDRVIIDKNFATRDLIRAMYSDSAYYVLILDRQTAKLLEAYNDNLIKDIKGNFPMVNDLVPDDRHEQSMATGQDRLIEEFFNKVDKALWDTIAKRPLPIILATEDRNYEHYKKVCDRPKWLTGLINRAEENETTADVVRRAWKEMKSWMDKENQERIAELKDAINRNSFASDINDIWNMVLQGRGKTLFVRKGYHQAAKVANNQVSLMNTEDKGKKDVIDDIVDELIEQTINFGGDVVFLDNEELEKFNNLALVLRF